jgi:S1-C subfamily serine protease
MASFGVVSAIGGAWRTARGGTIEGYIRADVTLYPGFSGGPLVDTDGRIVGLNSYYLARGQEIALPANAVTTIVNTLLAEGRIRRAYLGVTSQPVQIPAAIRQASGSDQETGLMIIGVEAESPADKGGLLIGDVLISVAGQKVSDPEDLRGALGSSMVGKATTVAVIRGGQRKELSVTPGERS